MGQIAIMIDDDDRRKLAQVAAARPEKVLPVSGEMNVRKRQEHLLFAPQRDRTWCSSGWSIANDDDLHD